MERFYNLYFDRVYGYVRRLLRDEHLAEDVTQDVFVHVHRALPEYDPDRELRPWVFTIATNKVRDIWNSRRFRDRQRALSFERDELASLPDSGGEPSAGIQSAEAQDALRRAIEDIPETMRATLLLRAYEGLSFRDIAELFDRSEVAVRKRYSRALAELRQRLEARGPTSKNPTEEDPPPPDPIAGEAP